MMWHPDTPVEYRNEIVTGDARELARRIPDESIDLVFADPIYDRIDDYRWLAETAARVLKADSACLAFVDVPNLFAAMSVMQAGGLSYRWLIIWYRNNEIRQRGAAPGKNMYTPCLLFDKGASKRAAFAFDIHSIPVYSADDEAARHQWLKPRRLITTMLANYARPGAVIFDPFTGGGTVPAVCKMLNRNYLAFEIDPDIADRARARVEATQAMHPVLLGVQEPMDLAV